MQPMARPRDYAAEARLLDRRTKLETALASRPSDYLKDLLAEVDSALSRVADGTFGICEFCHEPIEADRLTSDPLTRFCIDHLTGNERRALEQDLTMSARIQAALLPPKHVRCGDWEVSYHYQPAGVMSGDHCDVIATGDSLYFLIGDVSGKGVAASILMAHLHAMFRSLIAVGVPLGRMLVQANRLFCESTMPNSFATLVCGQATGAGKIEIANAGHCLPLLQRGELMQSLRPGGLPLGLFCDSEYQTEALELAPGDQIVLYTDGLSEARNAVDQEYGAGRVATVVQSSSGAAGSVSALARDLAVFRGTTPQSDDVTIMVIRREKADTAA